MKIFLLLLLSTATVIAAPHASEERKLQQVILKEIIKSVKDIKDQLKAEICIQNVITTEHCTHKNFCKAGEILSAYKAEDLGLQKKDWLLPMKLVAYTRDINCKDPSPEYQVTLHKLLDNIYHCALKEFSKA